MPAFSICGMDGGSGFKRATGTDRNGIVDDTDRDASSYVLYDMENEGIMVKPMN